MRFPRLLLIPLSILLLGAAGWRLALPLHRPEALSPELTAPLRALAHLESRGTSKNLFFTPEAAEFLKPHWSQWSAGGASSPEELARKFAAVLQDARAWRTLDRERRFDAVLLTGDPARFRLLLDHLRKSPDWVLTLVDPTSLVFERSPATAWAPAELEAVKTEFKTHSKAEQVTARVQLAHRLAALGESVAGKALLDEAFLMDPDSAPAWTEVACNHAALGQWDLALTEAGRAMKADAHYLPALAAKADALFAFGKFDEALALTRKLIAGAPEDGQSLVLHAKVTHAAHAYREEIEALEKIIAKSAGRPTGGWRVYLAQAYAANGEGEKSLAEFKAALGEPDLTDQQRGFAEKGIARLQSREAVF